MISIATQYPRRKRGPKPNPAIFQIPHRWGAVEGEIGRLLRVEWTALDHEEEVALLQRVIDRNLDAMGLPLKPWYDFLRESAPDTATVRSESQDVLRTCLDLGVLSESQLDPNDLPSELPIVCVDIPGVARIVQRGPVTSLPGGKRDDRTGKIMPWPDLSEHRVIITSDLDGGRSIIIKPHAVGSSRPYAGIERRLLENHFPNLVVHLAATGLFDTTSKTIYLQRLVKAVEGQRVRWHNPAKGKDEPLHADHDETKVRPEWFGGFHTLDCRAVVLNLKAAPAHALKHLALRDGHPVVIGG